MPHSRKSTLGERVRARREKMGWTQSELAARIAGVSQQSIDQLERDEVTVPRFLPELAMILEVRGDWLRSGKGKPGHSRPVPRTRTIDVNLLNDVMTAVDAVLQEIRPHMVSRLYEVSKTHGYKSATRIRAAGRKIINISPIEHAQQACKS